MAAAATTAQHLPSQEEIMTVTVTMAQHSLSQETTAADAAELHGQQADVDAQALHGHHTDAAAATNSPIA